MRDEDCAPKLPNGRNPFIERAAWAAKHIGMTRAKVNWGYIVLLGILIPTAWCSGLAAWRGEWDVALSVLKVATAFALPVTTAVVVGNVAGAAMRAKNGGGTEDDD